MLVLDEADEMLNRGFKEQVGIVGCWLGGSWLRREEVGSTFVSSHSTFHIRDGDKDEKSLCCPLACHEWNGHRKNLVSLILIQWTDKSGATDKTPLYLLGKRNIVSCILSPLNQPND